MLPGLSAAQLILNFISYLPHSTGQGKEFLAFQSAARYKSFEQSFYAKRRFTDEH